MNRLSFKNRIRKKNDFLTLRLESKKLVSRHWILYFRKNSSEQARLAITTSSRYGIAVERNKFRRIIRDCFRINKSSLAGFDIHIVAKAKAGLKKHDWKIYGHELREDFIKLLHKLSFPSA